MNETIIKENAKTFSVVAGVLFILSSLLSGGFRFLSVIGLLATIVFAIGIFMSKKELLLVGVGVKTAVCLLNFVINIDYFRFSAILISLFIVLSYASFLLLIIRKTMPNVKLDAYVKGEAAKYIDFVPAACMLIASLLTWIIVFTPRGFIADAAEIAALFLAAMWLTVAELTSMQSEKPQNRAADGYTVENDTASEDNGYYDLAMHVILLFVTFGIWNYIWVYRVTKYLNSCPDEEYRNPTTKLLLYMFVPFYYIYWIYKSAQRIDKMAPIKDGNSEIATICLIVAIFVPVVAPILMQNKINNIATASAAPVYTPAAPAAPVTPVAPVAPTASPAVDAAEEIRKFKELLDSGAITQEEYDNKKKELLNL